MWFETTGQLKYFDNKLIVQLDQGIVDFYLSLIPKSLRVTRQKYPAHISVVRKQIPPNMEFWRKYESETVPILYGNTIYNGQIYFWLNAFSLRLDEIRKELGFLINPDNPAENLEGIDRPDGDYQRIYHITLGNLKNNSI